MPLMPVSETPEKVIFCVTGYTRSAAISETRIIFLEKQFANHVLLVKNNKKTKTITLAGLVSLPGLLFFVLCTLICYFSQRLFSIFISAVMPGWDFT